MSQVILFEFPFLLLLAVLFIPFMVTACQLVGLLILPLKVSHLEIAASALEMINRSGDRARLLANAEYHRAWRRGEIVNAGIWRRVLREIVRRQADPRF